MNRYTKLALTFITLFFTASYNAETVNSDPLKTTATNSKALSMNDLGSSPLEQELKELIDFYTNSSQEQQMLAVNRRIRFSGITDTRLFDIAEKNLLANYLAASGRQEKQYPSWLVQMLAFSGQEKYRATLEKVLAETSISTLKRHTQSSLKVLPKYQRWNLVISQNLENLDASQLKKARLKNMLNAQDPELVRAGASIADHFYTNDSEILDLAEQILLVLYIKASSKTGNDEYAEASAWLCKYLGNSGYNKYEETLTKVLENTQSRSIKRWAKKALKKL